MAIRLWLRLGFSLGGMKTRGTLRLGQHLALLFSGEPSVGWFYRETKGDTTIFGALLNEDPPRPFVGRGVRKGPGFMFGRPFSSSEVLATDDNETTAKPHLRSRERHLRMLMCLKTKRFPFRKLTLVDVEGEHKFNF